MSNYVLTPSAVRKLRGALAATPGNSGATGAPSPVNIDDYPPPFTVRWSASANDKQGAWVIWLPDKAQLVMLKDAYITPTGVTAEQALPAGWYMIDDAETSSDEVWLVATITKSGSGEILSIDAELSTSEGQATTGETVHNILVAEMETDAQTGAKRVKQYVDSAVVLGGEGGTPVVPDDVSTEFIPEPEEGEEPTGDEGKLQIKGFKSGQPADTNTIAEYLMGTAQISGQIWLIVRGKSTDGDLVLGYLPLDALNLYEYAKKTDIPTVNNGTLTIKQGTTTLGTFTANQAGGTTVTIPEPPTPPTVNDGTLTLTLGSIIKTFSANQQNNESLTVPAKQLIAGTNVAITVNGNNITISSGEGGGATSGFSGTRRTLALTRYDISTNQLQAKFFTETWANGLMTASAIDDAWSIIEGGQAVTETV